jgi:hypothetical protein
MLKQRGDALLRDILGLRVEVGELSVTQHLQLIWTYEVHMSDQCRGINPRRADIKSRVSFESVRDTTQTEALRMLIEQLAECARTCHGLPCQVSTHVLNIVVNRVLLQSTAEHVSRRNSRVSIIVIGIASQRGFGKVRFSVRSDGGSQWMGGLGEDLE